MVIKRAFFFFALTKKNSHNIPQLFISPLF